MKPLSTLLLAGLLGLSSGMLYAESAANTPSESSSKELNADVQTELSLYELIQQGFDDFAKARGIHFGSVTPQGVYYTTSYAVVNENLNSPNFINSRAMAYERAYLNAVSDHICRYYGIQSSKLINEYFSDESSDRLQNPLISESPETRIGKKLEVLLETQIDNALRELNVDPSLYTEKPLEAKRTLLQDAITRQTMTSAFGSAAGLLPVQTLEARLADGSYAVGIILRYDPALCGVAQSLAAKQLPMLAATGGITPEEALPSEEEMVQSFGVRMFFDRNGRPALLGFGQWEVSNAGTDTQAKERAKLRALEQATDIANSGLTLFITGNASFNKISETGEILEENAFFQPSGAVRSETVNSIVDKIWKNASIQGIDTLQGRSTIYSKILKHPSGQQVAVVAVVWSFDELKQVRPGSVPTGTQPTQNIQPEDSGIRKSRIYDF